MTLGATAASVASTSGPDLACEREGVVARVNELSRYGVPLRGLHARS